MKEEDFGLHDAFYNQDYTRIYKILMNNPSLVNLKLNKLGQTISMLAAGYNVKEVVEIITAPEIAPHFDMDIEDDWKRDAVDIALQCEHHETAQRIYEKLFLPKINKLGIETNKNSNIPEVT